MGFSFLEYFIDFVYLFKKKSFSRRWKKFLLFSKLSTTLPTKPMWWKQCTRTCFLRYS